jgi:hypothetical protein
MIPLHLPFMAGTMGVLHGKNRRGRRDAREMAADEALRRMNAPQGARSVSEKVQR